MVQPSGPLSLALGDLLFLALQILGLQGVMLDFFWASGRQILVQVVFEASMKRHTRPGPLRALVLCKKGLLPWKA